MTMKREVIYNPDLHFEHECWNRELLFWEDELRSFQNRLEELTSRWTDNEVLAQIEKFQNKFEIHENAIASMKDDIHMHETNMADHYDKGEDVLEKTMVDRHLKFRDRIDTERKLYHDLKKDLFRFLTKYM